MADLGRLVLIAGLVLLVLGLGMMLLGDRALPGNFVFRRGNVTVYFPLATGIILSIVLTILLNVIARWR
jgi:hypothetical protein